MNYFTRIFKRGLISSSFSLILQRRLFAITVLVVFFGCSDDDQPTFSREKLVDADKFLTRSASEMKTILGASSISIADELFVYDVELYKVEYKTHYKGEEITASGIVVLPVTTESIGMVSYQHGTIAANSQAPSQLAINSEELLLYAFISSPGFIGVVPDFIGFGSSKDILHPYYVEEYTAGAVIDLLEAARELAIENGLNFNKRLFLAGYSQGGYATMATHKSLEQEPNEYFDLIASFPASGGYDIKGMQEYFFGLTTYDEPFYIAYVAMAYRTSYDWTQPLTDFFQEPYASKIPALFDGTKSGSQINNELTTSIPSYVSLDLLTGIDTNPAYSYIVDAFIENSLLDWVPTKRMFMYHGTADVTVPFINSESTYSHFISSGASPSVVTFTPLVGDTHGTGVIPYLADVIVKMRNLK